MASSKQNSMQIQAYISDLVFKDAIEDGSGIEFSRNGKVNMDDLFSGSATEAEMIAAVSLAFHLGIMTKSGGFKRRCGITLREFKIKVWGFELHK